MPISYPFWLGNQFNFDPAVFPGYQTPAPQQSAQPQGLFAPPPSLLGQPTAGGESASNAPPSPSNPGFGLTANMGSGRGLGMAGTALGFGMGIPGLGVLGSTIGNLADMNMANTTLSQLGVPGNIGFLDAISPFTPPVSVQMLDAMRAFDFGRDPNMDIGFSDSPVGSPDGMGNFGGSDPGYGGSPAGSPDGSPAAGTGGGEADSSAGNAGGPSGSDGGSDGGWATGGMVESHRLMGMNPPGPDDGFGALDSGEFVLSAKAVKKLGKGVAEKLNAGQFDKKTLTKALKAKNPKVKLKKVSRTG